MLQLRYLGQSPIAQAPGNLDYGVLLTENREFDASAALMFDTDFVPLSRLRLQFGPQANLAWLATGSKTDVFALAFGASARYELIRRLGLSAFGSAFYSPGVLTFGQAHNMYDFTAGAEVRLAGRLYALGGYRWFKFTLVNEPDERLANHRPVWHGWAKKELSQQDIEHSEQPIRTAVAAVLAKFPPP